MTPFRLVLVTRRFWPLVGGAERAMANLAVELSARGCRVTILTARWDANWPSEITLRSVPVVRLPNPPQPGWRTIRYVLSLGRWLRCNRPHYDLVYVSMLKHDAYAALGAVGRRAPVVLRAEGAGLLGDCRWQAENRFGRWIKRRCLRASALVAPSRAIEQELVAAGYPSARVHYIPNGVPIPPPQPPGAKSAARDTLAEAHRALGMPPRAPLALYTGRLHPAKGLTHLVAAWKSIVVRWPNARLWLAGEGPARSWLEEQIDAMNLHGRVVLAGAFDNVDELLAAADLFVLPSFEEGMSLSLLEAMAAGLPIVATDIPGNRCLIDGGRHGLLVPAADTEALSAALQRLLDQPDLAARLGAAARQRAAAEFSLARMAHRHLALFENLIHANLCRKYS